MSRPEWCNELEALAIRFPQAGVSADLASMSLVELWGVLQYLRTLAQSHGAQ